MVALKNFFGTLIAYAIYPNFAVAVGLLVLLVILTILGFLMGLLHTHDLGVLGIGIVLGVLTAAVVREPELYP